MPGDDLQGAGAAGARHPTEVRAVLIDDFEIALIQVKVFGYQLANLD